MTEDLDGKSEKHTSQHYKQRDNYRRTPPNHFTPSGKVTILPCIPHGTGMKPLAGRTNPAKSQKEMPDALEAAYLQKKILSANKLLVTMRCRLSLTSSQDVPRKPRQCDQPTPAAYSSPIKHGDI